MANFALELNCSLLEQVLVSVTRVLWLMQVLLRLRHGSKSLLSTVWVKLWTPVSVAVFLGRLLVLVMEKSGSVWFYRDFVEPRTELPVQFRGYA